VDIEVVGEFNWAQALADFSVGNRQGETKAAVLIVVGLSFKSFAPPGSMTSQLRAHEERAREEEVLGESGSPHLREVFADPVNPAFLELVLNELEKPSQRTRSRMRQLYEKAWANTAWLQDNEAAGSLPELNEPPDGASSAGEADSLSALNDQPESAGSERLAERILAEALAGAPSKSKEEVDQVSPPPFPILVIGISAHRGSPDGGGAEAVRMSGRRGKAVRKAG